MRPDITPRQGIDPRMKCVSQQLGSGEVRILEAPTPRPSPGTVLVRSRASLISAGTETMLLEFGRSSLIGKARSQPERLNQVADKVATEGLMRTLRAVRDRLADEMTPGYCQAGVVIDAGDDTGRFAVGDRVVTNGPHAEVVQVAHHLAARIPDGVDFEAAAFTPLAAIALQGTRLAQLTLGETVVVFGLGLIGQLAVQIVRANGCRCIGLDTDPGRVALAERLGAVGMVVDRGGSTVDAVLEHTRGVGADAVLMTLASSSDEPMHQAAEMLRKRGRIILVGVTGLNLRRADFYEKELMFQVSCSYGPGRYDAHYEEAGQDYPLAFVRWTEQRNFEAVLGLMADGRLETEPLTTHRFPIDDAPVAYELLLGDDPCMGIVLEYPAESEPERRFEPTISLRSTSPKVAAGAGVAGVLGAGNFARRTLIPAARSAGFEIRTVVSSGGLSAAIEGERFGARFASSDADVLLDHPEIDTVFVLTRHDSHASLTARALDAGKHVFVEKPLGLSMTELRQVRNAVERSSGLLTVGFNRRFAPLALRLRQIVDRRSSPLSLVLTVNAGHMPQEHWTQHPSIGGGRVVGEACHFIDLSRYLVGAPIKRVSVQAAHDRTGQPIDDVSHVAIGFEDGSTAVVHYLASGSSRFPKERIEAFYDGKTVMIDNWRRLRAWGVGESRRLLPRRADKGHEAELQAFLVAIRSGGPAPIQLEEIFEVSTWSIRAARMARGVEDSDD